MTAVADAIDVGRQHLLASHFDIMDSQIATGKPHLFAGVDRMTKFAITQVVEKVDRAARMNSIPGSRQVPPPLRFAPVDDGFLASKVSDCSSEHLAMPIAHLQACRRGGHSSDPLSSGDGPLPAKKTTAKVDGAGPATRSNR